MKEKCKDQTGFLPKENRENKGFFEVYKSCQVSAISYKKSKNPE